jgi:PAS domain S-box-containing protein
MRHADVASDPTRASWEVFLDLLPVGMVVIDLDRDVVLASNQEARRLLGEKLEMDFLRSHFALEPAHKAGEQAPQGDAQLAGIDHRLVGYTLHRLKGQITWMILREFTSGMPSQEKLLNVVEHFRSLTTSAPEAIIRLKSNGQIAFWNPAAERLFGFGAEEALGKAFCHLLADGEEEEEFCAQMSALFATGQANFPAGGLELRGRRKDASLFPVEISVSAIPLPGGLEAAAILRDVSERRRAEEERAKLAAAVDSTADAISIIDAQGVIQYVNRAFVTTTGYKAEESLGHALIDRVRTKSVAALPRVCSGEVWSGRLQTFRKDGTSYQGEATLSPVRGRAGEKGHRVFVLRDITERTHLEAVAEAVNVMDHLGYVISGIRHELGNPINSIKMTLSVLAQNLHRYSGAQVKEYVDRALSETARVEYLLRALKSFNMFETPELKPVDLCQFIEGFAALVQGDLGKRGVDFRTLVHPEAGQALTDSRALQQVLLNVVANAADATEGLPSPRVLLHVFRVHDRLTLQVVDNGQGMSEEQKKNLFKPFHTSKGKGTGLGLVIARKTLAKLGGTIEVSSERGGGTIVDIVIPEAGIGH